MPTPITDPALRRSPPADTLRSVAGLISAIGDGAFAGAALASLNGAVQAASWSVYQLWPATADGGERPRPASPTAASSRPTGSAPASPSPSAASASASASASESSASASASASSASPPPPVLHLSASHRVADTTRDCFGAYRAGLYRRDRSFDALRSARPGDVALLRLHPDELPDPEHREAIYRRHGVRERLSAVRRQEDGSLLAVNLYHHDHQGPFEAAEVERFAGIAGLVLTSVCRHLELVAPRVPPAGSASPMSTATSTPTPTPRERLAADCPALTPRELDVCERLLRGWSFDGVAADLGLSLATVKTYRARAFERLGLHFRSELFARFGAAPRPA